MRSTRLLLVACVSAAAMMAACGSGASSNLPRQIDISTLTFEDVQQRAVAAITRDGQVFHVTTAFGLVPERANSESWIDTERDLARKEGGGQLRVYYSRRVALTGPGERMTDAPIDSALEKTSIYAVDYLTWIFEPEYTERSLHEGTADGKPAIIVQVSRKLYDYDAIETAKIYLDESFLPLRLDYDSGTARFAKDAYVYRREFIDRDSIAAGFFSPDAVGAVARTPLDDIADASAAGAKVYWLGERFEDMAIEDASFDRGQSGGENVVHVRYKHPDFAVPVPCARVTAYGAEAWRKAVEGRNSNSPGWNDAAEVASVPLDGGVATVYREARPAPLLPTVDVSGRPPVGVTVLATVPRTPGPFTTPNPGPPALPDVPADTGARRWALLPLDSGGMIEVEVNCGPPGSNVYRTDDGFVRLVRALRPYAGR